VNAHDTNELPDGGISDYVEHALDHSPEHREPETTVPVLIIAALVAITVGVLLMAGLRINAYVQHKDQLQRQRQEQIDRGLAKWARDAVCLHRDPTTGEMVAGLHDHGPSSPCTGRI